MQKAFKDIVERLEELREDVVADKCPLEKNSRDCELQYSCEICYLTKAIENVNQFAEEYRHVTTCYLQSPCEYQNEDVQIPEEEVCEWKWGIDYAQVQCMGDKILFGSRRLFTYCPYCGKKIKVVE